MAKYDPEKINMTKLAHNDFMELWAKRRFGEGPGVMAHSRIMFDARATLAEQFVSRWGMVAATPDGEDSAGRQKVRLATPIELAHRACEMISALTSEFAARGWILEVPSYSDVKDAVQKSEGND